MYSMAGPSVECRPRFMEVLKKFIKRPREPRQLGCHYYPMGAVVLCKLSYSQPLNSNFSVQECLVFRSRGHHNHAEARLLSYLHHHRAVNASSVIAMEVFQNLSPCNDSVHSCAQELAAYKVEKERRGIVINIEITFANFYRTARYSGNPRSRGNHNSMGLRLLQSRGIKLKMLTGKEEWTRLLWDDELVDLSYHEKMRCLEEAMSFEGVARELDDKWMFYCILGVAANRLSYEELMNQFIMPNSHSNNVLVCKISYLQNGRWCGPECLVLRGGVECAEAKLIHYLEMHDVHVSRIAVHVIQNCFPCSERMFTGFSCVRNILSYKRRLQRRGKTICISFKLRSYPIVDVRRVAHDRDVKELFNGESFRTLIRRQDWEAFLRDRRVVDVNDRQVEDLLRALSLTG